jgi:hypothetical protein
MTAIIANLTATMTSKIKVKLEEKIDSITAGALPYFNSIF